MLKTAFDVSEFLFDICLLWKRNGSMNKRIYDEHLLGGVLNGTDMKVSVCLSWFPTNSDLGNHSIDNKLKHQGRVDWLI